MTNKELAESMGFSASIIEAYEDLKSKTMGFKNDEIAELDIIYFLDNILWSANFELVAKVIKARGSMVSRLDQWKEAIKELEQKPVKAIWVVNDPQSINDLTICECLHKQCVIMKENGYTHISEHVSGEFTKEWEIDEFIEHYHPKNFNK